MKKVLALCGLLVASGHAVFAGGNILTCDVNRIVIDPSGSIDLIMMNESNPGDTLVGWTASPDDAVIIFCGDGQLTIAAESEKPIRVVLSPQEGAVIEK